MTQWLNPGEQQAWREIVTLITRMPGALDTQLQREAGLTHFEYWTLSLLSDAENQQLQMSELAHRANASLSRLSHVMSKLERMGWAERSTIPGRRGVHTTLTDAGRRKVTDTTPGYVALVRTLIFDGLNATHTATLADLGETLNAQITQGIRRLDDTAPPAE